jgi:hypothetical protein
VIAQWYSAKLRAAWLGVRVPEGVGNFSLHHRVQTGSEAQPATYSVGSRGSFPRDKTAGAWSWPLISIYYRGQECVELYLHSPNTTSWLDTQLKSRGAILQKLKLWFVGWIPTFRGTALPPSSVLKYVVKEMQWIHPLDKAPKSWRLRQHGHTKRWYPTSKLHGGTSQQTTTFVSPLWKPKTTKNWEYNYNLPPNPIPHVQL